MPRPRLAADSGIRPMRTAKSSLRRKLGDDAENPAYIFTEIRVGYRMPRGEARVDGKEISNIGGQHAYSRPCIVTGLLKLLPSSLPFQ